MMVSMKDSRFSYTSCRFSPCNNNSARHVLFESLQIPLIYTVESSLYGYQRNDHNIIEYLPNDYREMGKTLIDSFFEMNKSKMRLAMELNISSVTQDQEEEYENERKKEEQLDVNAASDSDPSGDEYEDHELKAILPNLFGKKKNKEKKEKKTKKKKAEKKEEKEEVVTPLKSKKNEKQSHYRIYFSGRHSSLGVRPLKELKPLKETKEVGVQASFVEKGILKGSVNMSTKNLF